MPKIGFMLPPPAGYPAWEAFEQDLSVLAELGFDGVELALGDPAQLDQGRLAHALERHRLQMCSIGTGASYFEDGLCLINPQAEVREAAVERLKAHVELAARFGSVVVVGQMQGFQRDEPDPKVANARTAACLQEVAEYATETGVLLVLEPINRFEVGHNHTTAEVLALIDRVGSQALTIMLDTFHINIEEGSLDGPVRLVGDRLGHVHVFENHRGLFGTGHVDLGCILRATLDVGYGGYWVFGDFSPNSTRERAIGAVDFLHRSQLLTRRTS
jgi:sugar phosphate isomerase/epimerase